MVYKYLSPDRFTFFKEPHLSFSPPLLLNDPPDCMPTIVLRDIDRHIGNIVQRNFATAIRIYGGSSDTMRRIAAARDQMIANYKNQPELIRDMVLDNIRRNVNDTLGVLALAKEPDNELLWAYYCTGHEGFVVGFDEQNEFFNQRANDPPDCGILRDITYTDNRVEIRVDDIRIPQELFFTKKTKWAHENEVRMMRPLANADKTVPGRRYQVYLFQIPKESIREIVFGANASDQMITEICSDMRNDASYSSVRVMKAMFDNDGVLQRQDFDCNRANGA